MRWASITTFSTSAITNIDRINHSSLFTCCSCRRRRAEPKPDWGQIELGELADARPFGKAVIFEGKNTPRPSQVVRQDSTEGCNRQMWNELSCSWLADNAARRWAKKEHIGR